MAKSHFRNFLHFREFGTFPEGLTLEKKLAVVEIFLAFEILGVQGFECSIEELKKIGKFDAQPGKEADCDRKFLEVIRHQLEQTFDNS